MRKFKPGDLIYPKAAPQHIYMVINYINLRQANSDETILGYTLIFFESYVDYYPSLMNYNISNISSDFVDDRYELLTNILGESF